MKTCLAAALALAATCSAAFAVDFSQPVNSETGQPYQECVKPDPVKPAECPGGLTSMTLGHMVSGALNVVDQGAKNDDVVFRGLLALKVREAHEIDLNARERDAITKAMFAAGTTLGYRPVAIVQALHEIDPAALKDK